VNWYKFAIKSFVWYDWSIIKNKNNIVKTTEILNAENNLSNFEIVMLNLLESSSYFQISHLLTLDKNFYLQEALEVKRQNGQKTQMARNFVDDLLRDGKINEIRHENLYVQLDRGLEHSCTSPKERLKFILNGLRCTSNIDNN
jgi:hypothetical protein